MKKTKILSLFFTAVFALTAFTACSGSSVNNSSIGDSNIKDSGTTTTAANSIDDNASGDKLNIGIIQYGSHPSLDNCYDGIIAGLDTSDYKDKIVIDRQDGNFDSPTCDTIAKNMVSKKYDLIFAIATPAATSAYAAAANTNIPVIFCAVSDPVAAGLTDSLEKSSPNCTGTSDVLDLDAQVELIKTLQPDVKKIGILYTTSEANSISQLATMKEIASAAGIEIISQGVQNAADIPQAAASLSTKVDCINNFTDNNVVNNLNIVLEEANKNKIPVYGSEEEQVINGCLASISIDYVSLGKVTAEMAVKVLNGEKAEDMAVGTISEGTPVINTDVISSFNMEIPEKYSDAATVTTGQDDAE